MDKNQIIETFDLLSLVGRDTSLRKAGTVWVGPCPFCGQGDDRFTIKDSPTGYRWALRKCEHGQNGVAWWDPIKYIQIRDGISFLEAIKAMGGESIKSDQIRRKPQSQKVKIELPNEDWQESSLSFVEDAHVKLLALPAGELCRDYLHSRELSFSLWIDALLGFTEGYDPKAGAKRAALVIPHFWAFSQNKVSLAAVKLRFLDDHPDGLRYIARKGSKPLIYGIEDSIPTHETLLIVEGELNRLSIKQCSPINTSVISPGSENISQAQRVVFSRLARRFRRVLIWTDKGEKAKEIRGIMGRSCDLRKSPNGQDANDLLQTGILPAFLQRIGIELHN